MDGRHPGPGPRTTRSGSSPNLPTFLQRLHSHAPNSTQLIGFLTLVISGGIALLLTGLTLTATVLALIFFTPLILLLSPIWVPAGTVLFIAIAGFLAIFTMCLAVLGGVLWTYKYVRGRHPSGSDRVDYAMEYGGGYLQTMVKDAAPGA